MGYMMKQKTTDMIREKYRITYVANFVGVNRSYFSLILNRKYHCSKRTAYCITKALDENAEIEDFFDRV